MNGVPTKQRSVWNFSLRELMLLVTAVAALLALAVKSYPSRPTEFFSHFNCLSEFHNLLMDEFHIYHGADMADEGRDSWAHGKGRRRWSYASHQTKVPLSEIAGKFANRVETALNNAGCSILHRPGHITIGQGLTAFGYSYKRGATSGEFFCEFVDQGEGNYHVDAFCHEFTKR
jgi:hypothetical protein